MYVVPRILVRPEGHFEMRVLQKVPQVGSIVFSTTLSFGGAEIFATPSPESEPKLQILPSPRRYFNDAVTSLEYSLVE
jgi:hypothetical protein